jgi:hypothetical protein
MRKTFLLCFTLTTGLAAQDVEEPLDRKRWVLKSTLGPESLAGGLFSSGLSTWRDKPVEYDTHWTGFGQRYGMRMAGIATQNIMEAGIGAALHEDPRYHKATGSFKQRIMSTLKQTALTQKADGTYAPAYARYAAITGGNFISNSWRPDSEATVSSAFIRTGYGFLGRLAGNAFSEFGSEAWRRIRRR